MQAHSEPFAAVAKCMSKAEDSQLPTAMVARLNVSQKVAALAAAVTKGGDWGIALTLQLEGSISFVGIRVGRGRMKEAGLIGSGVGHNAEVLITGQAV